MLILNPDSRVLVVVAHADDEAIGCGGLLMKHQGPKSVVAYVGIRKKEFLDASITANFIPRHFNYPDQKLDGRNQLDLNIRLEEIICLFKPNIILTHSIHDNNFDHQQVHNSVNVACRDIPNLLYFRVPSLGEFPGFEPRVSTKINWTDKKKLLKCYDSEMRPYPHPRSYIGMCSDKESFELGRLTIQ